MAETAHLVDEGHAAGLPARLPSPRRIVGVQFRHAAAMIHDFDATTLPLPHDTRVVVETDRGEAIGWTVGEPEEREPVTEGVLRRVLRIAGEADDARQQELRAREREALRFCAERARQLQLPMKVIAVEWTHSGERAAFYFSSEERIDFRTLVRDLAQRFRLRVEMRQVGPRDEAKIIGAMGPCGRETCCSSWMRAFTPVSIKMAKDQGLAINPQKVTGVCGRLLCCLAYEQDTYRDLRRKLPRFGKQVMTPRGPGRIMDVLVLRERVRVAVEGADAWVEFAATEVRPIGAASSPEPEESEADSEVGGLSDEPPAPEPQPRPEAKPREPQRPRPRAEPPPSHARDQRPRPDARPAPRRDDRPARPPDDNKGRPPGGQRSSRPEPPRANPPPPAKSAAPAPAPAATPEPGSESSRHRRRHRPRRQREGGKPEGGSGPSDPA